MALLALLQKVRPVDTRAIYMGLPPATIYCRNYYAQSFRQMASGSHSSDNDPEVLHKEKIKHLSGEQQHRPTAWPCYHWSQEQVCLYSEKSRETPVYCLPNPAAVDKSVFCARQVNNDRQRHQRLERASIFRFGSFCRPTRCVTYGIYGWKIACRTLVVNFRCNVHHLTYAICLCLCCHIVKTGSPVLQIKADKHHDENESVEDLQAHTVRKIKVLHDGAHDDSEDEAPKPVPDHAKR